MKKSTKRELMEYAFEALSSELESYCVQANYRGRWWYDTMRCDCPDAQLEAMRLVEAVGDDWPYRVVWAKKRRYYRVVAI